MKFATIASFIVFPLLAVATPTRRWGGEQTVTATTTVVITATPTATTAAQCNTGPIQCCDSTEMATTENATSLLGLLGIVLEDLNVLLGINCSPISVIGVGGTSCDASPVCCENNNFNGLISIGCSPIIINL